MRLSIYRSALGALSAVVLLGVFTASASAAAPATTLGAQYVTSSTAVLRGRVATHGERTLWAFQYGHTRRYGETSNVRVIPAGRGTVIVALKIVGLRRHTRYHFRLLTQNGQGSVIYPIYVYFGRDRSFVTRVHGRIGLGPTTLVFRGRYAPVSLYCAGRRACLASLRITYTRSGRPRRTLILGHRPIRIGGGRYHTFAVRLSNAALSLLKHHGNTLGATLVIVPRHELGRLTRHVTLVRRSS